MATHVMAASEAPFVNRVHVRFTEVTKLQVLACAGRAAVLGAGVDGQGHGASYQDGRHNGNLFIKTAARAVLERRGTILK